VHNYRTCSKCGLIQMYDEIWGFQICDAKEAILYGCPPKSVVMEIRPDYKYDESKIIPPPKTRPFFPF
jgi:hypothetical protein